MPQCGDKMYSAFCGKLRVVQFVREEIAPGATLPTYIMREGEFPNREHFRCPTDMYVETEQEAWEIYLRDCENVLPSIIEQAKKAQDAVEHCKSEIEKTKARIAELTPVK